MARGSRSSLTWPVALIWRTTGRQPPAVKAFLAIALEAAERQDSDADAGGAFAVAA